MFFALWGIPFVLIGLHLTVGRFIYDAYRRSRTNYGVTTERVLIATGGANPTLKSLNLRTLSDLTLDQKADGTGTITFGPTNFMASVYAGTAWPGVTLPPRFELIPNANQVYDLIREAQQSPSGPTA